MSEAAAGGGRADIKRKLIERSLEDEAFRQKVLADPKAAIEQELGARLPESIEVRAVEETPEIIYLVLPRRSADVQAGELSDQELEAVSGGLDPHYTGGLP